MAHRDLNDEGEELDEPLRHVGEHLRLAVIAGHLQKLAKLLSDQIINFMLTVRKMTTFAKT